MTDFAAMSHPDRLLHLAGLEGFCEHRKRRIIDGLPGDCPVCHDTGKVPRFPMLRLACFEMCIKQNRCIARRAGVNCHGRGFEPVQSLEALLEAADTTEWGWSMGRLDKEGNVWAEVSGIRATGATPAAALSLALCRAVEGEKRFSTLTSCGGCWRRRGCRAQESR